MQSGRNLEANTPMLWHFADKQLLLGQRGAELHCGHQEFLHWEGAQALQGAAHGGGGVSIPRGVQGLAGRGTQCSGLVDTVLIKGWTPPWRSLLTFRILGKEFFIKK